MNFVVAVADVAPVPLNGTNPPGGKQSEFQSIEEARQFAEEEKDN